MRDIHKARPAYMQVAEHYRASIGRGDYLAGQRIPSAREIAEEWPVSHGTAARALNALAGEGLIELSRGLGYVVRRTRGEVRVRRDDLLAVLRLVADTHGDDPAVRRLMAAADNSPGNQEVGE